VQILMPQNRGGLSFSHSTTSATPSFQITHLCDSCAYGAAVVVYRLDNFRLYLPNW
jgi:hypothetical protein